MRPLFLLILFAALISSCRGDDDDEGVASEDSDSAATVVPTANVAIGDQAELDETITEYLASNFPDELPYRGDCEDTAEPLCGQFRGIDIDGNEYILIGDPGTLRAFGWVVVRQGDTAWEVVIHDLSNGWSRRDMALITPGVCQEVRAAPGMTGAAIECLEPLTPVTVSGGPRLADDILYFPIGMNRWVPGARLCNPQSDEGCGATS